MNPILKAIGKDIFSIIFNKLEFFELLHCRLVCKVFREFASGDLPVTRAIYEEVVSVKKLIKTGKKIVTKKGLQAMFGPITKDEERFQKVVPPDKVIDKGFFRAILEVLKSPERLLKKTDAEIKSLERELKCGYGEKTIRKEIEELTNLKLKLKAQIKLKKRSNDKDSGFVYKQRKLSDMIKEDVLQ